MPLSPPVRRGRPPAPLPLDDFVDAARSHLDPAPGCALLRVTGDPPQVEGLHLGDDHPLDSLLGLVAPPEWWAIGLHAKGRGYEVPEPHEGRPPSASLADRAQRAVPVTVTLLVDRTGHSRGALRDGDDVRRLQGLPEGVVGDACRRALGLPTAPPPHDTVRLWLHVWLDRVIEAAQAAGGQPLSWDSTARLHPSGGVGAVPVPEQVVEATHDMAASWSWSRLRLDPEVVDTGRPPLERVLSRWMDDGMYARWVQSELVDLGVLAPAAERLLSPEALDHLAEVFALCHLALPAEEPGR